MRHVNTFIGSPVERVEDLRFLRGRGQYRRRSRAAGPVARRDRAQPGRAWPHPRRSMPRAALAMPGVHAVITARGCRAADPDHPVPAAEPDHRALRPAGDRRRGGALCRRAGRGGARRQRRARRGRRAGGRRSTSSICRRWPTASASARGRRAADPQAPHSNCATVFTASAGDVEAAFRNAAYTRREQFRVQRMTAMTMETRGLLAEWDAAAGG